ncbi:MAG: hypothetical protein A2268_10730 [Candidatus Raymondbacteria bacterium RifOxyA12_full_50_37]|nr:MAG: hypothetical protein A2268_10730 [Candidatus Raymondbacteria bacterium RifOxyA12_full_50_37]OGJ85438.1 MAG: hypothetical protein A2248_12515 [Candidatus Raymondbacteria bacterium RIFOXYA2_FULL_49_16]OGJ91042.1 MAG: hypothetical protein A2350_07395 [Candidatus Raymondbacteria bacterium RifOxyB12_full_50_8]OGJ94946.1 MAG: hypothetical protein A2453_07985 [Candidatus Raymondbacteria bacterium RIFOXYC2_FULL_50_21]OGK04207.1 MAG: hypothetical protein A2487_11950 [Candidatus Raymondbacteria b
MVESPLAETRGPSNKVMVAEKKRITRISNGFFGRMALPTLLTICLFVVSIFAVIIPAFKANMLDRKRETIRELTRSTASVLKELEGEHRAGRLTLEEAQGNAIRCIESLRYGDEGKDYFWITDMHPFMIMHPYRKDLNNTDLTGFTDPHGKKLFVEFVNTVRKSRAGYVEYMWQWKDDSARIVPKLSYVEEFAPWKWIIGTGIYIEDVRAEINRLTTWLIRISGVITLLMAILLLIIMRQGLSSEQRRRQAEERLRESKERYLALVEANTDGLILAIDGVCAYANRRVLAMTGYGPDEIVSQNLDALLFAKENDTPFPINAPSPAEARLKKKKEGFVDIVCTATDISFSGKKGRALLIRDISVEQHAVQRRMIEEREQFIAELQAAQLFLSQPVKDIAAPVRHCPMATPVREAAELMSQDRSGAVLVTSTSNDFIGIVTDADLRARCVARKKEATIPVFEIMSSPLVTISDNALVYEAMLLMQHHGINHLAVKDARGKIVQTVSHREVLQVHRYSSTFLVREISAAETVQEMAGNRDRLPMLIKALLDSGANARTLTRIVSQVSDTVVHKVLDLAIEELGVPPCAFAFVVLGSEGREEQTLATDQDNAIIYEENATETARSYFLKLGETVCTSLNRVGFNTCPGEIMASNLKWCQPLSQWKSYFSQWINTANPQDLIDVNVFFDFRFVYGDIRLPAGLHEHIDSECGNKAAFFMHLAKNALAIKPPLGIFGALRLDLKGEHPETFDIKKAMMPLVDFARIQSLRKKISQTNTPNRLEEFTRAGGIDDSRLKEVLQAYDFLMHVRFKHQIALIEAHEAPDNNISPAALTAIELALLKKIFSQFEDLQTKLSFEFTGTAG